MYWHFLVDGIEFGPSVEFSPSVVIVQMGSQGGFDLSEERFHPREKAVQTLSYETGSASGFHVSPNVPVVLIQEFLDRNFQ